MKRLLLLAAVLTALPATQAQTTIFSEDFETDGNGTRYTTSIPEFSDTGADYFIRTQVGGGVETGTTDLTGNATFFFAAQDIDGEGADARQTLTFSGIDISGFTNLTLSMDVAESDRATNPAWDEPDLVHASFVLGGTAPTSYETGYAIWFDSNTAGGVNNTNQPAFSNFDFDGDGGDSPEDTEVTPAFTTFTRALGFDSGDATTVDLVITFDLNSGGEDIAIDNIVLTGTPAGGGGVQTSSAVGWRQLGAPEPGLTVDDLAQINLVSGAGGYVSGTDCQVGDVTNLFTSYSSADAGDAFGGYDPAADGEALQPGAGFFWYFFGDTPGAGFPSTCDDVGSGLTSVTRALPITLPAASTATTTDVQVTFTDAQDTEGFYLIANPYETAFDLSGVSAADGASTAVGLQDAFQAWDPEIGAYVTITTDGGGDLTDADADDISIWQGVWAERTCACDDPGDAVVVTFDQDAKVSGTDGDAFYARRAQTAERRIAFEVTNGSVTGSAALVRFVEGAGPGWDRSDLSKIGSMNAAWAQIGPVGVGRGGDVVTKAIESRAADVSGSVEVPLAFTTTEGPGDFTLTWPTLTLGEGWVATLTDEATGTTVDLSAVGAYTFAYTPGDAAERFTLTVANASTDGESGPALAEVGAVYPNPTAGTARLAVTVAEAQAVTVEVFDAVGRRVAVAFDGPMAPGAERTVDLATGALAPGVYVVRVQGASFAESRRLVVAR